MPYTPTYLYIHETTYRCMIYHTWWQEMWKNPLIFTCMLYIYNLHKCSSFRNIFWKRKEIQNKINSLVNTRILLAQKKHILVPAFPIKKLIHRSNIYFLTLEIFQHVQTRYAPSKLYREKVFGLTSARPIIPWMKKTYILS